MCKSLVTKMSWFLQNKIYIMIIKCAKVKVKVFQYTLMIQ